MKMTKEEIAAKVQEKMALWRAKQGQGANLLMNTNVSNDSNNFAPRGGVRVLPEPPASDTNSVAPSPTQDDDATNSRLTTHLGERDNGSEDDVGRESISVAQTIGQDEVYHLRADFFDNGEACESTRYKVNIHFNLDRASDFDTLTVAFASRQRDFLANVKGSSHFEFYQMVDRTARRMAKEEGFAWDIRPIAGKLRKQQRRYGPKESRAVIPGCAAILACEEGGLPVLMLWLEGFHAVLDLSQPPKGRDKCGALQSYGEYVSEREQADIHNGGREEIGATGLRSLMSRKG